MHENRISSEIVDAAIEVHRHLGPGLLEKIYQEALAYELDLRGLSVKREVSLRANYKGLEFDSVYRLDMLVHDKVVVELKVVETILPVHEAQLLSYLRLLNKRLGMLINFHTPLVKQGIKRVANNL
ncbi:MAG: GxxExxY protein [Gammaproteobacteria bacterium]|nr:GxxExxY protein [Gammaproteobacteria bacterium]